MKVRILTNTLHLRLRQPEVRQFKELGKVLEIIEFGPAPSNKLGFPLEVISGPELIISFESEMEGNL